MNINDNRKALHCYGGPYDGRIIHLSWGVQRTLTFSAKGHHGHYNEHGTWVAE